MDLASDWSCSKASCCLVFGWAWWFQLSKVSRQNRHKGSHFYYRRLGGLSSSDSWRSAIYRKRFNFSDWAKQQRYSSWSCALSPPHESGIEMCKNGRLDVAYSSLFTGSAFIQHTHKSISTYLKVALSKTFSTAAIFLLCRATFSSFLCAETAKAA